MSPFKWNMSQPSKMIVAGDIKQKLRFIFFGGAASQHIGLPVRPPVCQFQLACWEVARRRQTSYNVARLLLMAPIDPWRNATSVFGAVAFCTTNIEDLRSLLMSTFSTILQKWSLRWTNSKRKLMEVIEVDQLGDTNNERLSWAMPHSGLKA